MPPRRKVVNGPATTGAPATSSASSSSSFLPVASAGAAATSLAVSQESLKDQGNRYFASGNYDRAIDFFTRAIDLIVLSSGSPAASSVDPSQLHILYSNRSATYNALRMFPEALSDAEQTIAAAPRWAKGYFRKGSALEGLLQFNEAAAAYAEGLKYDGNDPTLRKSADDLAALLKELRLTESELSKQNNPDADRFDLMVRWLKEGGGKFPRLYLQYYSEDYRGVHCLSRIPAEEIILYVPHHMIMTSQVAMDSGLGKQIVDAQLDLRSKHSYLAAYLLQERRKGKESYWEPYINSLPAVYANMPIHFSPEMLAHLKGSFTLEKIADRIESLRAEYDNICAHVPDMRQFTHAEFVWARLAVITRIFGLVIGGVKTDGLVAYADMLNHAVSLMAHTVFDVASHHVD
jgi:tetratricopeptide (TPR) repeat protein